MSSQPDKLGNGWRFQICRVKKERLIFVEDEPSYVVACVMADILVQRGVAHHVVWDRITKQTLYDSRKISPYA